MKIKPLLAKNIIVILGCLVALVLGWASPWSGTGSLQLPVLHGPAVVLVVLLTVGWCLLTAMYARSR